MNISYSRVSAYLKCPYAHYLGYVEGLRLKKPVRPLYFGSDFHKLLELRNDPKALKKAKKDIKETFYDLPASWQTDLGENYVTDIAEIFSDYRKVWKESPQPQVAEHRFELPLGKFDGETIYFVGVIDELYLYKRKGQKIIKIGEHKTFNRKPDMNTLVMNVQKCLYAKATQKERGVLPQTVIWDYIKSTPATRPIWLEKTGRFSEATSQTITPFSWRRACIERNIGDPDILEKGKKYEGNIQNFFFKAEMEVVPDMVEDIFEGFVYTCKDLVRQGHKNKTKNVTMNCTWCNFRDICFTQFTGGDVKYLIEKNYQQKEPVKPVEEEE